jgi:hypothetical protein
MLRILITIFVQIASLASIFGFYFTIFPLNEHQPIWHVVLLTLLTTAIIVTTLWEIVVYWKSRPKIFKLTQPSLIREYMRKWVAHGGRVVIFTRDMSWADTQDIINTLHAKARRRELTICIQAPIALTNDLKESGAEILPYAELGHVPRSRFTIVDFEREGARVAVGGTVDGKHMIQEFTSGHHPFFAVAEDLVKLILAYQRQNNV